MLSAGLLSDRCESVSLLAFMFRLKNKSQTKETGVEFYKLVMVNILVPGFQRSRGFLEKVLFSYVLFVYFNNAYTDSVTRSQIPAFSL